MTRETYEQSLLGSLALTSNEEIQALKEVLDYVFSFFFFEKEITDEIYHWDWTPRLFLKQLPIVSLSAITAKVEWEWKDISNWTVLVQDMWFIYNENYGFPRWYSNIKVSYTAGYEKVPADLNWAIKQYFPIYLQNKEMQWIKNESIDDYSVTFDKSTPSDIQQVFNKYSGVKYYV